MAKVGELLIDLGANVARLQQDMDKGVRILSNSAAKMQRMAAGVGAAFAGIGVGLSVGAFASGIKNIANAADELGKLGQKVGVSVESLSALKYAGQLSDVSMESLSTGLKQLNKSIDEGDDAFKRLGLNLTDANGKARSTEEVLGEVAERFSRMDDGAAKTALAMELFGKSGADLIPLLNGGKAGLQGMADEAARLGIVISGDTAKAAEKFNDNLTRLGATLDGVKLSIGAPLIATLGNLTQALLDGTQAAGGFWNAIGILGTINPFKDVGANLREINDELDRLNSNALSDVMSTDGLADPRGRIERLEAQKRYLQSLQRREAMSGAGAGNYDARDLALRNVGPKFTPGAKADPKADSAAAAKLRKQLALEDEMLESSVALHERAADLEIEAARNMEAIMKEIDRAESQRERDQFDASIAYLEQQAQQEIAAADEMKRNIDDLARHEQRAAKEMIQAIEGFGRSTSKVFADALVAGDFTFDKLKDVARSFFSEMIEQQLYSNVFSPLLGAVGAGIGAMFGGGAPNIPTMATGTNYVPQDMLAFLHQGEAVVPKDFNPDGMGGGGNVTVVQNIHVDSRADMQSTYGAMKMARDSAKSDIMRSMQRNGAFAKATR